MDIRQLETLVAVADTGSFAGAARVVNLTASAVSQQIQALEGELGSRLFDRGKRPPQLNAKGEEILRAARSVTQVMTEARLAVSGSRTSGMLKIGAIRTISRQLVPLALLRMRALYPDLTFHLSVDMSEKLMLDVSAGRLDAAVVAEQVGVPPGLSWAPVLIEPLVLAAPPEMAGRPAADLLRDLPFIRYETDVPLARQIETELARLRITPREIMVCTTMPSIIGCVQVGLGVAVVPKIALADAAQGSVHAVPFGDSDVTRRLGIVRRQVSSRSDVLTEMRSALSHCAAGLGLHVPEME